ncbi:hypothetical protein [Hymenobacter sp. UYP22]|uniref:hypothetical protein n=1 Tax=Hymenobacter sp. UYP22 TaxID=3156348 RepID=UPI0033994EB8
MRVLRPLVLVICLYPVWAAAQPGPVGPQQLVRQVARAPALLPPLPLKEARRTLDAARRQFQRGLPTGAQLYVVTRGLNEAATPELLVVRVLNWRSSQLSGQIIGTTPGPPAPLELPEGEVLDWLILHPGGREEGNYLGKYWDLEERLTEEEE